MLRKLSQLIRPRQSGRRANCQRRLSSRPAARKKKVNPRDKLGRADSRTGTRGGINELELESLYKAGYAAA